MALNHKALVSYLTDHMAGSVTAGDLAERGAQNNKDGPLGEFYANLAEQIDADRRMLREIADRVGAGPSPVKEAAAMAGERLSRLKMDHRLTSNPSLILLLELEMLYLGIQGKNALWRTLQTMAASETRLAEFDYNELRQRAERQLAAVDEQRLAAAVRAFGG
jgi:hypothetical protein